MKWYRYVQEADFWNRLAGVVDRMMANAKFAAMPVANLSPYDIVFVRNIKIRESSDSRPCLITRVLGNGKYEVSIISGNFGQSDWHPEDFQINDFSQVGLKKPSVIKALQSFVISDKDIVFKIGHLSGDILSEYLDRTGRDPVQPIQPVYTRPNQPPQRPK